MGLPKFSCGYFYIIVFLVYLFTLWYDWFFVLIGHEKYAGKFKYLTFLNLILQTVYFTLCALNSLSRSYLSSNSVGRRRTSLEFYRDTLHASLVFPIGMFVVMSFWVLYAVDRELIFPQRLDKFYPLWLNHMVHTVVLPVLLADKYFVYHRYPPRHIGLAILYCISGVYLSWIFWVAHVGNFWVYPVLQVLGDGERVVFLFCLLMLISSIYFVGESVTNCLWRKQRLALSESRKRK